MPIPSQSCQCFDPSAEPRCTDRINIGVNEDYWELSRMRCAMCGTVSLVGSVLVVRTS